MSGGAHGNLGIDCLNYDLVNNQKAEFQRSFQGSPKSPAIDERTHFKKACQEPWRRCRRREMIAEGYPDPANFKKNLTLTPNGLYVEFQPYQVGPLVHRTPES